MATLANTTRAACRINSLNNRQNAAAAGVEQYMHSWCNVSNKSDDEENTSRSNYTRSMREQQMPAMMMQKREYHLTIKRDSVALAAGLTAVAVGAKVGQYGFRAFEEWQKNQPKEEPKAQEDAAHANASGTKSDDKKERVNFFDQFGFGAGSKYYEGGFEDKMTRREAALILGVRESATVKRIKGAHRKILILNHPDTGGSTYMTSKINEAKELLLKGKE